MPALTPTPESQKANMGFPPEVAPLAAFPRLRRAGGY